MTITENEVETICNLLRDAIRKPGTTVTVGLNRKIVECDSDPGSLYRRFEPSGELVTTIRIVTQEETPQIGYGRTPELIEV